MVKIHYVRHHRQNWYLSHLLVPGSWRYAFDDLNVDALQGNKAVTILEATKGEADIGGSFIVSFCGLSDVILYNETQSDMATKLSGIIGEAVAVTRQNIHMVNMPGR